MRVKQDHVHRLQLSAADAAEVHRFVARRVANAADAADIAQQTLLRACAKLGSFRGPNRSAWLLTIARHLIVDHFRAQRRARFVSVEAELAETEPRLQTPAEAVLAVCERRERLECWLNCITHRLRPEEQVAVLLADIYGHRDKESASVMGLNLPSFKLLLHGARARLHGIAGGNCMLVSEFGAAARAELAKPNGKNADGCKNAGCGNGGATSVHLTHRLGVTCRLRAPGLLALRSKLLEGLAL